MTLLGDWNWWLPRWLGWLPQVTIEGHVEEAREPAPESVVPRSPVVDRTTTSG